MKGQGLKSAHGEADPACLSKLPVPHSQGQLAGGLDSKPSGSRFCILPAERHGEIEFTAMMAELSPAITTETSCGANVAKKLNFNFISNKIKQPQVAVLTWSVPTLTLIVQEFHGNGSKLYPKVVIRRSEWLSVQCLPTVYAALGLQKIKTQIDYHQELNCDAFIMKSSNWLFKKWSSVGHDGTGP